MIVLVDNYDSFSYNLYQLLGVAGAELRVVRNDELTVGQIVELGPQGIVLSPGPGRPANAGVCEGLVRELSGKVPILGVCLGHQAICEAFGGVVTYASRIMHGKASQVQVDNTCLLFSAIGPTTRVGRYHSLVAQEDAMPSCLRITARAEDGEVMAVSHVEHPTFGLQFNPESILTTEGRAMAEGFMAVVRGVTRCV